MNNIFSLVFGLLSWGMACVSIGRRGSYGLCFGSFTFCVVALWLQLKELQNIILVREDISAAMDTIGAVVFAATVLIVVAVVLNGIALLRGQKR